jgi:predicted nuclease of restriction endonuclease-like RecB superfamily
VFLREPLGILDTLIEVYSEHRDKKRGELNEVVSDCEYLGYDFKLVRGLAAVLDTKSSIPPIDARRQVFTEAAETVVASREERLKVLETVAERNGITVEMLDDSLYADLADEQYLIEFSAPNGEELMRYYNYANMIALLAYSLRLEITYKKPDEYIESLIKRIGSAKFTGSVSTRAVIELKPTRRLSQRADKIDSVMRRLIDKPEWSLKANVKYPTRYKTVCVFEIDRDEGSKLLAVDQTEHDVIIEIGEPPKKKTKYGDIIVLDDLARRQGVTTAKIKREIEAEGTKYRDLRGVLVTPDKHNEIRTHLKALSTLGEAQIYFKELGVRDFMAVLEAFGYQVEWSKPRENSKIYRL